MNRTIKAFLLIVLMFSTLNLYAQVDEARMDKDLRVASKVLESLTQGGDNGFMMYSDNVEANYIDGYGVIFTIGGGYSFFMGSGGRTTWAVRPDRSDNRATIFVESDSDSTDDAPISDEKEFDFSEVMIEFLIDYSQMINQLKPTDRIMVSTKKSDYVYVTGAKVNSNSTIGTAGMTTEMLKKDHMDYLSGKITRDDLKAMIKVKKNGESNRSKDLDLFASMLSTVYDDEYTDSYFISWKPEYQRLEGVGAIYSFKVYSSYDEDGWYRMPGIDKHGLNSQQRNEEVEKLYPVFIESMKANIVQYGRTIASLEPNEMVLLKVTLTKCDDCSIPKKIQFGVKQSVLKAFRAGEISEKEAISKVTVANLD